MVTAGSHTFPHGHQMVPMLLLTLDIQKWWVKLMRSWHIKNKTLDLSFSPFFATWRLLSQAVSYKHEAENFGVYF